MTSASDYVTLRTGVQILGRPVSLGEFAEFLRLERYFDDQWWDEEAPARTEDGDRVLTRVSYRYDRERRPVRNLSWFEAQAFCRSEGGRLPYFLEWRELAMPDPLPSPPPPSGWWPWRPRPAVTISHTGTAPLQPSLAEWCADWYDPNETGPFVVSVESIPARRVAAARVPKANPEKYLSPAGFRVVREHAPSGNKQFSSGAVAW